MKGDAVLQAQGRIEEMDEAYERGEFPADGEWAEDAGGGGAERRRDHGVLRPKPGKRRHTGQRQPGDGHGPVGEPALAANRGERREGGRLPGVLKHPGAEEERALHRRIGNQMQDGRAD